MELDDSGRYALGALFTIALHGSHVQAGAEAGHPSDNPWGEHEEPIVITRQEDGDEVEGTMASRWDAFWGYDIVTSQGLLDRIFQKMDVDSTSWQGLKSLPLVLAEAGYPDLIQQYRGVLDREQADSNQLYYHPEPLLNIPDHEERQGDAKLADQVEPDDEDLRGDLKRMQLNKAGKKDKKQDSASTAIEKAQRDKFKYMPPSTRLQRPEQSETGGDLHSEPLEKGTTEASRLEDDTRSASDLASDSQAARGPTPASFTAATQLLEASVANMAMPQLDDLIETDKNGKAKSKVHNDMNKPGDILPPNVRWYDARTRQAIRLIGEWLNVPWDKLLLYECLIAQQAQAPEKKGEGSKKLTAAEKRMRALKIGAAAAGGGAILALTGGLAAPALAAVAGTALTTVGGAAAATTITGIMGSTVGAAALIAGFGAGGAKFVGGKMARRIGDVEEFGFRDIPDDEDHHSTFSERIPSNDEQPDEGRKGGVLSSAEAVHRQTSVKKETSEDTKKTGWLSSSSKSSWLPWSKPPEQQDVTPLLPIPVSAAPRADPKLAKTIAVAGIVADPDDFVNFWKGLADHGSERFTLVWETKELIALKNSMVNMIKDQAYTRAGQYLIENFVIHGLVAAVALPMTILSASSLIDSNWAVVMNRAARAGELLAHLLMSGAHGDVPVTLIGNSMGARLVYHCLLELCRCKCKGIVENAYMLGTPVDVLPERWTMARSVVAGKCVNGYSKKDWVLALSFRAQQGTFRPASGLGPIPVAGIENVDLTDIVNGHGDYVKNIDGILARLGLAHTAI